MQLIRKKEKLKMWIVALAALLILLFIGGCSLRGQVLDGDGMVNSYKQISQEEAAQMMEEDDGHVIVDVRTQEEYDEGHIPGAICIPNEEITDTKPELLPDVDQVILIYCRSGRRSKEAAEKLFNMGYTHIYEFGGIIDWTGEIEKEEE
ncbi:MAG: rhodanese-like domain-containing protein [Lachnospiraceae bacterium]|nr:rhodanese-like domain-containing protein [Lachnospiraceae bacterium]